MANYIVIVKDCTISVTNEKTYEDLEIIFENNEEKNSVLNNLISEFIKTE